MNDVQPARCPHCEAENLETILDDVAGVYFVQCLTCGMSGPCESTEVDAVTVWNELPRKLRWMRSAPKTEGWYWHKNRIQRQHVIPVDKELAAELNDGLPDNDYMAGPIQPPVGEG
ncbi:MAG: hypothetical protein E7022_03580 [Desulfovibrio desulfuricans]|nr:hypothetical protein [Desulfovibrio desulfuricans]